MTLQEAILAITPQDVHNCLVTMCDDIPTDPGDGACCPLWHFFTDKYPDESVDDGCYISTTDVDLDNDWYALPKWMTEFQLKMIEGKGAAVRTLGAAVELLEEMYGVE